MISLFILYLSISWLVTVNKGDMKIKREHFDETEKKIENIENIDDNIKQTSGFSTFGY